MTFTKSSFWTWGIWLIICNVPEPLILDSPYSIKSGARVVKLWPTGPKRGCCLFLCQWDENGFCGFKMVGVGGEIKRIILPDMWKLWNSNVRIRKVLLECSHTPDFCTVCGYFCTTVGRLNSCYRNCFWLSHHLTFLFGMPQNQWRRWRGSIWSALSICTTTLYLIFSVTRSYPLCQNKKTAVWMMCLEGTLECGLSYQMIRQNSVSSNDTVTAKKQYMLT